MVSLMALRDYLQTKQRVSLTQLTIQFSEQDSVIEGMLQYFIRKGKVRQCCYDNRGCKGCPLQCTKQPTTLFEWLA